MLLKEYAIHDIYIYNRFANLSRPYHVFNF